MDVRHPLTWRISCSTGVDLRCVACQPVNQKPIAFELYYWRFAKQKEPPKKKKPKAAIRVFWILTFLDNLTGTIGPQYALALQPGIPCLFVWP